MSNPDAIAEIVERLERASGPDRKLDAEIACAIVFRDLRPATPDDHKESLRGTKPSDGDIWCPTGFLIADSYTASIDAALALVPEGNASVLYSDGPDYRASVEIGPYPTGGEIMQARWSADAETLAIALCIAALRARQSP